MPEGPEVRRMADGLREYLVGKDLADIQYDTKSRYANSGMANLSQLRELMPLRIISVKSMGKKIIISLGNRGELIERYYLVSSLGLEGHWTFKPRSNSNLWLITGKKDGRLFILDEQPLYFDDSRHFGTLEIILTNGLLLTRLKDIGPDLLTNEITFQQWYNITRSGKQNDSRPKVSIQRMQICKFLMEQKYVSGIGNYLKSEILYHSRIRPDRTVGSLSENELERIRYYSLKIIRDSYNDGGHTLRTYTDLYGSVGNYSVVVYMKQTDPYGNAVRKDTFSDGRTTHWVDTLQK